MGEITVYRVQHRDTAYGPYHGNGGSEPNWLHHKHSGLNGSSHPEPSEDYLDLWSDAQVCGMADEESLERWFSGCGGRLAEEGFVVGVYSTPTKGQYRAQVSPESGQVVFWADPDGADYYKEIWW